MYGSIDREFRETIATRNCQLQASRLRCTQGVTKTPVPPLSVTPAVTLHSQLTIAIASHTLD